MNSNRHLSTTLSKVFIKGSASVSFLESTSRRQAIDAQFVAVEWERNRNPINSANTSTVADERRDLKDKTVRILLLWNFLLLRMVQCYVIENNQHYVRKLLFLQGQLI